MNVHHAVVENAPTPPATQPHEPWCDLRQHALALVEAAGQSGCVGRYISYGAMGGWIAEDAGEPGTGSRLVVDWRPAEGWDSLRPEEAAQLSGLLARLLAEQRRPAPVAPVSWAEAGSRLFFRSRRRHA